mmetsp:Transcript_13768/g.15787  ORF Transcript_13768/g.15787 Transcript_13768/m.15787 type:complete len:216 (+) Transcript_13768:27-674(+)
MNSFRASSCLASSSSSGKSNRSGCLANSLKELLNILRISILSLHTIVFSFLHHRIGVEYFPLLSSAISYKSRMVLAPFIVSGMRASSHSLLPCPSELGTGSSPGDRKCHPQCSSFGSSGLVLPHVGWTTEYPMTSSSRPLYFNAASVPADHGHARETYRWYRLASGSKRPPFSTALRKPASVRLKFPCVSISSRAVCAFTVVAAMIDVCGNLVCI